jgi:outer membrane lipoprotein SlyB
MTVIGAVGGAAAFWLVRLTVGHGSGFYLSPLSTLVCVGERCFPAKVEIRLRKKLGLWTDYL